MHRPMYINFDPHQSKQHCRHPLRGQVEATAMLVMEVMLQWITLSVVVLTWLIIVFHKIWVAHSTK